MSTIEQLVEMSWSDPPSIYRGAPFWSWNSELKADRLCRAIDSMHAAGMGGFFMHSRYGLKTPYLSEEWFECVRACVAKARELGMKAYLYDEDRWPSGSAGGLITRERPENRARCVLPVPEERAGNDAELLARFAVSFDEDGRMTAYRRSDRAEKGEKLIRFEVRAEQTSGWHNDGTYPDVMRREVVAEFIRTTHQAYAERFGKDFGDLIPAIFTDEPRYGVSKLADCHDLPRAPWTARMLDTFKARRGYDLLDRLPEVLLKTGDATFNKTLYDFYRTATECFVENYSAQIGEWCGENNIAFTGHMLAEGTLGDQISVVGACMPHYEHMQWPGIDILCDQADELMTAKQCSSVADQLGRDRVLSELYGCTGWDWPIEGHKFIGDWQFACGVNFRCQHLTHYSLAGGAKRDYPASIFAHSPWWKYYRVVEDYFARLSLMLTHGRPRRDVLVIHPVESGWGVFMPGDPRKDAELADLQESLRQVIYTLSGEHYDWDFGDESLLAKYAEVDGKALKVGQMTYRIVVVPPALTLRATTAALLREFISAGGKVLFVGQAPDRIDGKPSDEAAALVASARACADDDGQFVRAMEELIPRRVRITEAGCEQRAIWAMLREIDGGQLLFVQSHDRREGRRVHVQVRGDGPVVIWDVRTGERHSVDSTAGDGGVEFDLDLPATGSALLTIGLDVPGADRLRVAEKPVDTLTLAGPWEIELCEPNTLPLDYCSFRFAGEQFSKPVHSLKADAMIRERFSLGSRTGGSHQPWYLYATGVVDTAPRGRCEIRRVFHVTDLPPKCALAIERPEDFEILVNGEPAGGPTGWLVDEDIRTLDITHLLRTGDNEVMLRFDYRADMELEDLYLVGDFGVAWREGGERLPGNTTLTTVPKQLHAGDWVGQGLDFYGGSVRYRLAVDKPSAGRLRIRLPETACTAAAIHVGAETFVLPWPPFAADITDALAGGGNEIVVEVIGGRKNILGPLHTPWKRWTGHGEFNPDSADWTDEYLLNPHGLLTPPVAEVLILRTIS